ncbi:hypothetical protein TraAM80_01038 [Trypanosoma rangeli]|uniref:Uncharacterized protein n=1 Tax=Trypanosoma rangeli TaxID=5698 RepID=A0A422P0J4_TRYRA|nr:uncharacterized protein TraAM80_01038 [Trypanosoma rangeli]RNF11250.1 hypothetical protein TraAM80_01038 [Trypanosoma rangeli]|eukprot:RNF11250.1 hypothetical protein TraAM80_01038 [Trypanosoma rangeli]
MVAELSSFFFVFLWDPQGKAFFMRRAAWCCRQLLRLTAPHYSSGGCQRIHLPVEDNLPGSSRTLGARPLGLSETTNKLALNALSMSVRRLLENSPSRWWEMPGLVDTLLTVLLHHQHQHDSQGGSSGALHPLLGSEIVKGLGFAVWTEATCASGGWARRSGLSKEDLAKVANCVLRPLLSFVARHPKVRPLLPVILEWLVCISDIPLSDWLPQLSLYLDDYAACNRHDARLGRPLPSFLLQHMTPTLLRGAVDSTHEVSSDVRQVLDRMLHLLVAGDTAALPLEKASADASYSVSAGNDLVDCLFWQGETPLILRNDIIREAYARFCQSPRCEANESCSHESVWGESQPLLTLPVVDDDVFRRLLLRLLPPALCGNAFGALEATSNPVFLVKPLLKLGDSSMTLRLITPLSEFVSVVLDGVVLSPLRLSFDGVKAIIYSVIGELQRLQRGAPPPPFPLLPHKPRIHTLKALCDRLLCDAEQKLKVAAAPSTFPGAPLQEQVQILYSFSHAARRLVRAVQAEKTASLLEEGPEGSALQAGGAVSKHNDVTIILRNTAFRVLESSLFRYYDALSKWSSSAAGVVDENNDHVADTLSEIERHAGGRVTFFTARHILQHSFRHDATAVMEALRIVAIQALVLRSSHCMDWLQENFATTVAVAFFAVWHQNMKNSSILNLRGSSHEEEKSCSAFVEADHRASWRLLWTMLLLHQSCCSCDAAGRRQYGISVGFVSTCGVFRSLLDLLTVHGTYTEFTSFGFSLPFQDIRVGAASEAAAAAKFHVAKAEGHEAPELLSRCTLHSETGAETVGGITTRWELLEELLLLGGGGGGLWRWLGSSRAVREVVSGADTDVSATTSMISAFRGGRYTGYLLPWTTLAHSRHPLRLYDESGQSAVAADAFDANLSALLRLESGTVVRLVSLTEEAALFHNMAFTPELSLGADVSVIHPEALLQRACKVGMERNSDDDDDDDGLD